MDAAADLFSAQGYARTTLEQIAARAEVNVKLVVANGPKRDLLLAAFEQRFAGTEDPGEDGARASAAEILAGVDGSPADGHLIAQRLAEFAVSGHERGIGIWTAFSAAAREDAGVHAVYQRVAEGRYAAMRAGLEMLAARGMLRPGPMEQHVATLALLMGFDSYQLAVRDWGWSRERLRDWLAAAIAAGIVDTSQG